MDKFPISITISPWNGQPHSQEWSPTVSRMLTHHSKDGPPPPPIIPKILNRTINYYPHDDQPTFTGQSPTITIHRSVINKTMDGHSPFRGRLPASQEWSSIISRMVNQYPHDGHTPSPGWTTNNSRMVTISRIFNQKWSLTLAQPSLSWGYLRDISGISQVYLRDI